MKKFNQDIENPEPLHYKLESIKKQAQISQKPLGTEVPIDFIPDNNITYKIVTALNPNKAFTVSKTEGKLVVSDYVGDDSQRFKIVKNGGKFSFIVQSNNFNLCVLKDSPDYGATIIASPGKQASSRF